MLSRKKVFILLISLFLISIYFYYTKPNEYIKTYQGIKCRINNYINEEKIIIKFEGKYIKKPFSYNIFKGNIYINNNVLSNIELKFDELNNSSIRDNDNKHYGWMVMSKDKSFFTILLSESEDSGTSTKGWNYKNGLIISAPANSKKDALTITKQLLNVK